MKKSLYPFIHSRSDTKKLLISHAHSQLKDDCLSATTASCPLIESLILMSCPSVGSDGLLSLRWLAHLTLLDLSYTFLMTLQPVFESCLQLKVNSYLSNVGFFDCSLFFNVKLDLPPGPLFF